MRIWEQYCTSKCELIIAIIIFGAGHDWNYYKSENKIYHDVKLGYQLDRYT